MLPRPTTPTVSPWSDPGDRAGNPPAPHPGADLAIEGHDLAVPREQQRERVVGHLADPDVGHVDHDHAQLGGGVHVDDVVATPVRTTTFRPSSDSMTRRVTGED